MKQNAKSMTLILISILLALSGMAAMMASADDPMPSKPTVFYGYAAIGGEWAEPGTVISAHINGGSAPSGSCTVVDTGVYSLAVNGNTGDTVTFKINDNDVPVEEPSVLPAQEGTRNNLDLYIGAPPAEEEPPGDGGNDDGNTGSPGGGSHGGGFDDSGTGSTTTTTPDTADGESTTPGDGADGTTDLTSTESSDAQATDDGSEFHTTDEPNGFGTWVLFILIGLIAVAIIVAYLRKR